MLPLDKLKFDLIFHLDNVDFTIEIIHQVLNPVKREKIEEVILIINDTPFIEQYMNSFLTLSSLEVILSHLVTASKALRDYVVDQHSLMIFKFREIRGQMEFRKACFKKHCILLLRLIVRSKHEIDPVFELWS